MRRGLVTILAALLVGACEQSAGDADFKGSHRHSFNEWMYVGYLPEYPEGDPKEISDLTASDLFDAGYISLGTYHLTPIWMSRIRAEQRSGVLETLYNELIDLPPSDKFFFDRAYRDQVDFKNVLMRKVGYDWAEALAVRGLYSEAREVLLSTQKDTLSSDVSINDVLLAFLNEDRTAFLSHLRALREDALQESEYCSAFPGMCHGTETSNPLFIHALVLFDCIGVPYLEVYRRECSERWRNQSVWSVPDLDY